MYINDILRNYVNMLIGKNQKFEQLLESKDISAVKEQMTSNIADVIEALSEYNTAEHSIMRRADKIITDKKGNFVKKEIVWKLPIPYQMFINEIALVFLYARPLRWMNTSEGTDDAYKAYIDFIKRTRFNAKIRQCKRLAGSETEAAMLFRTFRDENGKADCQIRVLARSKNDEIYTRFDQFENLITFAWGYYTKDDEEVVYHFDVYTKDAIYHCTKKNIGWDVVKEDNLIGKIPVIYFRQEKEWAGVEALIHREESIVSRTADTNDYFADPIAVMNADVIKNMPEKKDSGKVLVTNGQDGVNNAVKYLTWDNAPESKKEELDWLESQILQKTFTPNLTLDTLKSVSQLSAKALETVMFLADIKASRRKETLDELMDRVSSLITAIIGNVLNVSLKSQCDKMTIEHEFQKPFGEDVTEAITNLIKTVDAGILSNETAIEMNPLVKDPIREQQRINEAQEASMQRQIDIMKADHGE